MTGVWLTKGDNNVFTQIGLIVLIGLSAKNAILIVEFARELEFAGRKPIAAAIEASRLRLRPILMTSVATVAGAIPEALNFGPGAETRVPMAISIIGGVTVSTFLTLYVVPCVYSLFSKLERPELTDEEMKAVKS